ncbi:MAG: tRNA (guanosine(37)-N1)-methyltransferase TrmD [Planctomycetes bacterium]|nr:tRNA (guanosine(37)-N1)-methyltransferase TrmD [Planctomycetota bacterium]
MRIDVLTLFPRMFEGVFAESILKRAQERGLVSVRLVDIRDYSEDRHRTVDDRPYGGGPGMVLKPEPVFKAVESIPAAPGEVVRRILLTPQGKRFDQAYARDLAAADHLVLVCGHYEGFDERIREGLSLEEVSIGDFVLTGGEIPAMLVVDAVVRLVSGVLGDAESAEFESFSRGQLDHPHYTRPPEFRGMRVPDILLSGNHEEIRRWREEQSATRTLARRPDLLVDGEGAAGMRSAECEMRNCGRGSRAVFSSEFRVPSSELEEWGSSPPPDRQSQAGARMRDPGQGEPR